MNEVKTTYKIHMTDAKGTNLGTYDAARFPAVNDMITDPSLEKSSLDRPGPKEPINSKKFGSFKDPRFLSSYGVPKQNSLSRALQQQ